MATDRKSEGLMRALKEKLQFRFPTAVFTSSSDSNGNPELKITADATPTVLEAGVLLRLRPITDDISRTDALGLAQRMYVPHILDILRQKTAAASSPANTPVDLAGLGAQSLLQEKLLRDICFEASRMGTGLKFLDQANGTDASVADSQLATAVLLEEIHDINNPQFGEI